MSFPIPIPTSKSVFCYLLFPRPVVGRPTSILLIDDDKYIGVPTTMRHVLLYDLHKMKIYKTVSEAYPDNNNK